MLKTSELKAFLRAHSLRLSKRLGQNYLVDARAVSRIVDACGLTAQDAVIEIGSGLGALTGPLALAAGTVTAVEVDRGIAQHLAARFAAHPNVTVLCADILEFDWGCHAGATVVGAIPYHITSEIVARLCEVRQGLTRAWLIVQKEVGQRLTARPDNKRYGRLSLLGQYSWKIETVFSVPRSAFFPQPEVDSVLLRFDPRPPILSEREEAWFFAVVKAAFSQRRKKLVNCLADARLGLDRESVLKSLPESGFSAGVRGETLSLEAFIAVAAALYRCRR